MVKFVGEKMNLNIVSCFILFKDNIDQSIAIPFLKNSVF